MHDWVHLACHGIQDMKDPLQSAFALYDGKITIETLMSKSLHNAELAVLSACQTAMGDDKLPEESVHLAAAMLAIGYSGVVATMWSIGDQDAPIVAEKLYANLLEEHTDLEYQDKRLSAAYALHKAVKYFRNEVGDMNFIKWVPFIHLGI